MNKKRKLNSLRPKGKISSLGIGLFSLLICSAPQSSLANSNSSLKTEVKDVFQSTITGTVLDSSGLPLPGANVIVKGTTIGTQTDFDGNYSLNAEDGAILVFSYIGFKNQEVALNGQTTVDVTMVEDAAALEEVVVVGYGTQRKQDLTGAVSVVKVDELAQQPSGQVTSQLQGRVSGVTITGGGQPGESPQIKIRGSNTFGNNTPLYVVDGIPTDNINDINPNDIASMQVLKDAASASIYGSRAANGVIIITTKKGSGKLKVTYDSYYGVQLVQNGNPWDILNSQEQAELTFIALKNTNPDDPINHSQYGNGSSPVLPNYIAPAGAQTVDEALYYVNPNYTNSSDLESFYRIVKANKEGTNWFQEIFSPASITSHNLSISNGNDQGSYLFSMNYFDQQGSINNTYLRRYTIRANSVYNVTENIRIGENLSVAIRENPQIDALTEGSVIGMAMREQPIIPVYDIKGNYAGSYGSDLGNAKNPVAIADRLRNNRGTSNRIFGNIFAEIDFLKNFTFRTSFGGQYYSNSFNSFQFPEYENAENLSVNQYTEAASTNFNWTWTNTIQYKNTFADKHNLTVLVGTEAYQNKGREVGGTTQDYFSFDPDYVTLDTGSGTQTNYSFKYADALSSIISRADYNYDDRYLLSATLRRDGSSRFLKEQYGWFPAVSAGWNILNEEFIPESDWLNDLKLRGGYGIVGNQINVDPPNSFTTFGGDQLNSYYPITGDNSTLSEGFRQTRIGNPDAKWEKNINYNLGLDASLFNGKVQLTADYYKKEVEDLLYNPNLPATNGTAIAPYVNVGKMSNNGIDIDLSTYFQINDDLRLNTSATFTTYNNEIERIADGVYYFDLEGRRFNGSTIIRNAVGRSVSEFFGYQIEGFWNSQEEIDEANAGVRDAANPNATYQTDVAVGRFRYADVNGDGIITDGDRTFIGDPNPDFTYGLNIELLYKNWDLSMFVYGSQGNDIWNNVKWWHDFYSSFTGAKSKTALYDSWTPQNMNASAPIQETGGSFSTADVPNSYFVEDGSYLRARQIQLGYTFPSDVLKSISLSKLRLYAQVVNPFTITSYSGIDPEISGDSVNFGIDEGAYPNQKQVLFGVNVIF
ncbi:TonB-linked outer membrane protein, SusC/RagA family [Zobellia uliginosa]|uniref:TonB-linked outer membrane protein, SusC/RagA family n=1 Tax=Zobellia uliginosa TaxID=143224 RepID=A0ABY1KMN5_9FLAO|nr:TonB-dependent receptor [Zobellia uliginosa]SIS50536.1 TonB-linked outer membrane protein, SusC/RagA family [Zobellia uliginosa]